MSKDISRTVSKLCFMCWRHSVC